MFILTPFHTAIAKSVAQCNTVVSAGPGSGKTTSIKEVVIPALLKHFTHGAAIAFNGKNAYELKNAINHPSVACSTGHSAMYGMVRTFIKGVKVEVEQEAKFSVKYRRMMPATIDKNQKIAEVIFPKDTPANLIGNVLTIVKHMKLNGHGLPNHPAINDRDFIQRIIDCHALNINLEGESMETTNDRMIDMAIELFNASIQASGSINFEDMMYFAMYFNCPLPDWQFIVYDEAQDIKPIELEFLTRLHKNGVRIVAVGDGFQEINHFAGGMHKAINTLADAIAAQSMPLRVSYRCSHTSARLANEIFPDSVIPWEGAKQGNEYHTDLPAILEQVESFDNSTGILSRTHKNIMPIALQLLSKAIQFTYKGIDDLVIKMERNLWHNSRKSENLSDIRKGMTEYVATLQDKHVKPNGTLPAWLVDLSATTDSLCLLLAYCEGQGLDLVAVKKYLKNLANMDKASNGPTLSTMHASKGMQWDHVIILGNMISPLATTDEQLYAEKCLSYVALTRSSCDITFVAM